MKDLVESMQNWTCYYDSTFSTSPYLYDWIAGWIETGFSKFAITDLLAIPTELKYWFVRRVLG